ncbi:MAG: outer membrane beta-barrel protein [Ginsengibacter sp.]
MSKYFATCLIAIFCFTSFADAQVGVYIGPRFGYGPGYGRRPHYPRKRPAQNLPPFQPSVNLSFGYGFPNLDKNELPEFYNLYKGTTTSQTGPITGAVDYRFSRNMSIGVLVTHGKVTAPYYEYNNSSSLALDGSLDNWSVMLNFVRYIPAGEKVSPYIRTAIGINTWQQNYTDPQGNKINMDGTPSELAYQIGIGADFYLSKNAGVFLEGGYGKYILHGGLTFKF